MQVQAACSLPVQHKTDALQVDVIIRAAKEVHEFWANLIQIGIGTWLLTKQLGYAAVGPIVVALLALAAILFFSPRAKRSRVGWLAKTQERVGKSSRKKNQQGKITHQLGKELLLP